MLYHKLFYTAPLSLLVVGGTSFAGIKFVSGLNNSSYPISFKEIEERTNKQQKYLKIPELGYQNPTLKISNPTVVDPNNHLHQINISSSEELKIISEFSENLLSFGERIDSKDYGSPKNSVSQIFKEIQKEAETKKIDEEMKRKIELISKELKSSIEDFQKVSEKLKKLEEGVEKFKKIDFQKGLESISQTKNIEEVQNLTEKDKEVLMNFYEKFFNLAQEKKKLMDEFSKLSKIENKKTEISSIEENGQKILNSLKNIGWDKKANLSDRVEKLLKSSSFELNNDFSPFLNQDEWKLLRKSATDIKRDEIEEDANSIMRQICFYGITPLLWDSYFCYGDLELLKHKKDLVVHVLDWRIASKLMHDMKQVEKITGFSIEKMAI